MNKETLDSIAREGGWYIQTRMRSGTTEYYYARKKRGGVVIEIYIAPRSQLEMLTIEAVEEKLSKKRQNQCA